MNITLKVNNNEFITEKTLGYDIYVDDKPIYVFDDFYCDYDYTEQLSLIIEHKRQRIYVVNIDSIDTFDKQNEVMAGLVNLLIADKDELRINDYVLYYPGGSKKSVLIH